jgi:hypothetical protein
MAPAPLHGRTAVVRSDGDPALEHAGLLLTSLGARVQDEPVRGAVLALGPAGWAGAPQDCPVVLTPLSTAAQDWARSGAMALTGRSDGPALPAPGRPASAVRGALLLLEGLVRARGGTVAAAPLWPDVSLLGERAALAGLRRRGPLSPGGAYRPLATSDGWLGLSLARPTDHEAVPALVERDAVGDSWQAVAAWAATTTSAEAAARAQLLDLPGAEVAIGGRYDDEQARSRGGAAPAPVLTTAGTAVRRPRGGRPLVVDLTALWAGPLCAHLLGLSGADIVKVESRSRPDGARSGPAHFFDLLHHGHASVSLDFASAVGRAQLHALIEQADVVLESSRPRALRQLEVSAEDVVAGGGIWASITAYGRNGPWANRVGFGDDVAAAAGLVALEDGVPLPCGDALADPLTGVHTAVAVAAALLDDTSHLVDVSMRDVASSTLAPSAAGAHEAAAPPRSRVPAGVAEALGASNDRFTTAGRSRWSETARRDRP